MGMRLDRCYLASELGYVQSEVRLWVQAGRLAVGLDMLPAQRPVEHREGAAKLCARAALVERRPEQRGQHIAAVGPRRDRQVGEQGKGLAPAQVEWVPFLFQSWRSQQIQR